MRRTMTTEYVMTAMGETVHTYDPTDVTYARTMVPTVVVATRTVARYR